MSGKGKVGFTKPPEPKFLREIKEKIGYREPTSLDAKNAQMPDFDDEEQVDKEDERPTVVVLKDGDLSQDEAARLGAFEENNKEEEEKAPEDGRIMFKKPKKREAEQKEENTKSESSGSSSKKKKKKEQKQLLSFDEEEDDE